MKRTYIILFVVISYLLVGTGLHSDEFLHMSMLKQAALKDILLPSESYTSVPLMNYTHRIWFFYMDERSRILPWILKVIYCMLTLYFGESFFSIFMNRKNALMVSALFLFYPSHDTTEFTFLGEYIPMTITIYLYSFYLLHKDNIFAGTVAAFCGAFFSYTSPPVGIALFVLFLLFKEYKKAAIIIIPEILYIFYNQLFGDIHQEPLKNLDLTAMGKQFILQIATFFDAVFGPSIWLKIYYSMLEASFLSILIGIVLTILIYLYSLPTEKIDKRLLISLSVMTIVNLIMYALINAQKGTPHLYFQTAFGFADRATTLGSSIAAYLFITTNVNKVLKTAIVFILILSILGLSNHWKGWEVKKESIIENMRNNQALRDYKGDKMIFIVGNRASRLGRLNHIELFSEERTVVHITNLLFGRRYPIQSLNPRYSLVNGYIMDTKTQNRIEKVDGYLNIYDSDKNMFFKLPQEEINGYIKTIPPDERHWAQLIKNSGINSLILSFIPSLRYALH